MPTAPLPVLTGQAAVYGNDGVLEYTGSVVGNQGGTPASLSDTDGSNNKFVSASLQDENDKSEIKDGKGRTFCRASANDRQMVTFVIIPFDKGATPSLATAKTKVALPTKFAIITIANNGVFDGTYNYEGGGSLATRPDGFVEVTLPCSRWPDPADGTLFKAMPIVAA